jgi:hypothetical protein
MGACQSHQCKKCPKDKSAKAPRQQNVSADNLPSTPTLDSNVFSSLTFSYRDFVKERHSDIETVYKLIKPPIGKGIFRLNQ